VPSAGGISIYNSLFPADVPTIGLTSFRSKGGTGIATTATVNGDEQISAQWTANAQLKVS